MGKIVGKILEIIITNVATLAVFAITLQVASKIVPEIYYYYKVSLLIIITFLIYQDIKILLE